jgi:flagellar basal-body rod modification protein FlgD
MTIVNTESDVFTDLGLKRKEAEKTQNQLAQEDFLNLMVTQLKNQDPFKPMENGDFLAQIAQFASVTGIDDLNKSFSTLSESLSSNQALQAGALVDREVLAPLDYGLLPTGGALRGELDLPSSVGNLVISITDATGALIRELPLGSQAGGRIGFSWDGQTDRGEYAPSGIYKVEARATIGSDNTALQPLVSARVDSVSLGRGAQGLTLNLEGLGPISFNDVAQIH